MEWVIALLAVGCVFFGAQVIVDYIKYKKVIEPRIDRMEKAKADLRSRIEEAEAELGHARAKSDRPKKNYSDFSRSTGKSTMKCRRKRLGTGTTRILPVSAVERHSPGTIRRFDPKSLDNRLTQVLHCFYSS